MDMDLLHFSNDHTLHHLLDNLVMGEGEGVKGVDVEARSLWTFDTIVKILELSVVIVGALLKLRQLFQR